MSAINQADVCLRLLGPIQSSSSFWRLLHPRLLERILRGATSGFRQGGGGHLPYLRLEMAWVWQNGEPSLINKTVHGAQASVGQSVLHGRLARSLHATGFLYVGGRPVRHSPRTIYTLLLDPRDPSLQAERTQGFAAHPVYGRAECLPMLGSLKT